MIRQASAARAAQAMDFAAFDAALGRAQRYFVMAAVVVVPLLVLPESQFLDFTSTPKGTALSVLGWLLVGLMGARSALKVLAPGASPVNRVRGIVRESPVSAAIVWFGLIVGAWPIVSSLASPFGSSFTLWGREPGAGGGAIGAALYMALGMAAFWSARDAGTVRPFVLAIAASAGLGAAAGAAQYFGFSPLGISSTNASAGRVTGTAGNPVFFGAMLAMTLPLMLTLRPVIRAPGKSLDRRVAAGLVALTILFTVALVATASRGPWLGAVGGLLVALGCLVWLLGPRQSAKWAGIVAVTAVVTVVAMSIGGAPANAGGDDASTAADSSGGLARVGATGSIERRFDYWSIALDLSVRRPEVPFTESRGWFLQFMFGYGPDTARYVLPLEANAELFGKQFTAVHNDPLNRLLEQGAVGFMLWAVFWGALTVGVLKVGLDARKARSATKTWLVAGVAGALGARFVEQLSGVAMPGDQVFFWVIVGLLAALCATPGAALGAKGGSRIKLTVGRQAAFACIAATMAVVVVAIAWERGAEYLAASHAVAAVAGEGTIRYDTAVTGLSSATSKVPDVSEYRLMLADIYRGAGADAAYRDEQLELFDLAYYEAEAAFDANPFELDSNFRLAQAAWDLGQVGVAGKSQEAVSLYERMALLAPAHPLVIERLQALRTAVAGGG